MATGERFSALSSSDFRLFWFGQLISLSGTWMQSVAQAWLVYSLTKSPFYLGLVAAAGSLPILTFSLLGGIVADRIQKRNLLLITQALSIIPALSLGILTGMDLITVWHVALLATFLGTVNAFDIPARQAFVIEIVGKEHLTNAIALNSAAFNGARIVGPVIAGLAIAYLGLPACFFLNAVSFIAVIIALSKMKIQDYMKRDSQGLMKDFMEGIHFVKSKPEIYSIILLIGVFSLLGIPYITFLPVFAGEVLQAGPKGYGFLVGATGVGALSGALFIAFRGDIQQKKRFMSVAALCFSCFLLVFSLSRIFYLSIASLVMLGWGMVSFLATANSFVQLSVSDSIRGRVMSVYALVFLGVAPLGNSLIGMLADSIGTTKALSVSAVICIIGSVLFMLRSYKLR
ncbi:MAG TPA: MFS transporter [Thermodesulfovibrionales bacterium]|nr:MFS transporter [Thermodesulfovibrionales bacterium]